MQSISRPWLKIDAISLAKAKLSVKHKVNRWENFFLPFNGRNYINLYVKESYGKELGQ